MDGRSQDTGGVFERQSEAFARSALGASVTTQDRFFARDRRAQHMAEILDVTDATFEREILKSETPVLIDFWAEWCAPCKQIAPIVKELAASYDGKVKIVKMNIDENPGTPGRYGVRAIPTVLAFKNGAVVGQLTGARPKSAFVDMVQKLL
jgi:thioredoxin 1